MSKKIILIPFLFFVAIVSAQDTLGNTLKDQFIDVVDKSNNYQEYKVIKRSKVNNLRSNVFDTIAALEQQIKGSKTEISEKNSKISSLEKDLNSTSQDLALSQKKENGITVFGIITTKTAYNSLMWSIIILLFVGLAFIIYKFATSHAVTKEAQLKLAETEIEFESHRQKSLEKEQKLRRKLQDEINKKRKGFNSSEL